MTYHLGCSWCSVDTERKISALIFFSSRLPDSQASTLALCCLAQLPVIWKTLISPERHPYQCPTSLPFRVVNTQPKRTVSITSLLWCGSQMVPLICQYISILVENLLTCTSIWDCWLTLMAVAKEHSLVSAPKPITSCFRQSFGKFNVLFDQS